MSKLQQWVAGTAVVVIAVLVAGWFFGVSPKRQQVADLNSQTAQSQGQIASLRSQIAVLVQEKKDLPAQEAKIAAFQQQIPGDAALPTLIRQLSAAASSAGVDLKTITPGTVAPLGANAATGTVTSGSGATGTSTTGSTTTGGAAGTATGASTSLSSVPMQLNVSGQYFQLEEFIANLEQLKRRFLVTSFTLGTGDSASGAAGGASTATTAGGGLSLSLTGTAFATTGFTAAAPAAGTSGTSTGTAPTNSLPAQSGTAN